LRAERCYKGAEKYAILFYCLLLDTFKRASEIRLFCIYSHSIKF